MLAVQFCRTRDAGVWGEQDNATVGYTSNEDIHQTGSQTILRTEGLVLRIQWCRSDTGAQYGTGFMEASNAEVSSGVWGHDSPEFHY